MIMIMITTTVMITMQKKWVGTATRTVSWIRQYSQQNVGSGRSNGPLSSLFITAIFQIIIEVIPKLIPTPRNVDKTPYAQ